MSPKTWQRLVASLFVIGMLITPARAAAQAGSDQWRFSITPYLWLPSLEELVTRALGKLL